MSDPASLDSGLEALGFPAYAATNSVAGVARVVRAEFVTPRVRRITVTSDELSKLPPDLGWNRPFRAYFSRPGFYDQIYVPALREDGSFADTFALSQHHAVVRAFTIRRFEPAACELSVDFVLHEHQGIASEWAASAREGSGFGFLISKLELFSPPLPDVDCMLLVGDETAIPHIANTLAALSEGRLAKAVLEVADEDEEQHLDTSTSVRVKWVHRDGAPAGRSGKLQEEVRSLRWPEGRVHAFVAGEARVVGDIRRFLRDEHNLVRRKGQVVGHPLASDADASESTYEVAAYWRLGATTTDDAKARQERFKTRVAAGADAFDLLEADLEA